MAQVELDMVMGRRHFFSLLWIWLESLTWLGMLTQGRPEDILSSECVIVLFLFLDFNLFRSADLPVLVYNNVKHLQSTFWCMGSVFLWIVHSWRRAGKILGDTFSASRRGPGFVCGACNLLWRSDAMLVILSCLILIVCRVLRGARKLYFSAQVGFQWTLVWALGCNISISCIFGGSNRWRLLL